MTTIIRTALPELDLQESSTLIVTVDSGSVITGMTVQFSQDAPEDVIKVEPYVPQFVYTNAAGKT